MTAFWVGVAALSAVALAFLLVPLWRQRRQTGRWSMSGIVAAVVVVPLAFGLYLHVRTWQPEVLEQRNEEMQLVARLAERMAQQPEDVEGWRLLGRSYVTLGEYGPAVGAFEEAWKRTPNPDAELKLSYAEAQVLADRSALEGAAGDMIEDVLAAEPGHPKALWYGAQRALGAGDEAAARTRLTRLLSLGPPEEIAQIVRMQLAQLPGGDGAGEQAAPVAAADGPSIRVRVRLGTDVPADALEAPATLFIFARDPNGGPPVAVVRQPATAIPGEFVLSDANTMLPGRSLGDFAELNLVARVSASGQPLEQPGDLYGEHSYRPGEQGAVDLVIDKVAP